MSRAFQRQDDPVHVARLEEYLSKSELEPLESAIKEPRKFASDVVCQDCLYDALHTSYCIRPCGDRVELRDKPRNHLKYHHVARM